MQQIPWGASDLRIPGSVDEFTAFAAALQLLPAFLISGLGIALPVLRRQEVIEGGVQPLRAVVAHPATGDLPRLPWIPQLLLSQSVPRAHGV